MLEKEFQFKLDPAVGTCIFCLKIGWIALTIAKVVSKSLFMDFREDFDCLSGIFFICTSEKSAQCTKYCFSQ